MDQTCTQLREAVFEPQVVLKHPDVVEPLRPFEVRLEAEEAAESYALVVDGRRVPFSSDGTASLLLSGPEGERVVQLVRGNEEVGSAKIRLEARTFFEAGRFTDFFTLLRRTVDRDSQFWPRRGKIIYTCPCWFRDHVHAMKAYKYWKKDLSSFADALIELQRPEGWFYEIIADQYEENYSRKKLYLVEPEEHLLWVRIELEADVEYLMVEAVHTIWQATGDAAAMQNRLPSMVRALEYDFSDPVRWDSKHGALKRPFTIDTWDFAPWPWGNYWITQIGPNIPMGIMHGDNSGLYQACRQVAKMYSAVGESVEGDRWDKQAEGLRERVNRLCFNGRYYTHQILLQPFETGVREEDILSLSNPYDINRGLATHEMALAIIDEYQKRRVLRAETHFAEWFTIDPPYPKFGAFEPGKYVNGGIAPFVGGELAKAALEHGREAYGVDILNRLAKKVAEDGYIDFLYDPKGKRTGGGAHGWGAAAIISTLLEALAGIKDEATCFTRVTISPRFAASGINEARVCARYGPSGAYVSLDYRHVPADGQIHLAIAGVAEEATLRVLLHEGAGGAKVVSPSGTSSKIETVEQSRYLVFALPEPPAAGVVEVTIQYGS